jgi:hypothetical protein
MVAIKDFLINLQEFKGKNKSSIIISELKNSNGHKPIIHLTITKSDIIKFVLIPLLSSMS